MHASGSTWPTATSNDCWLPSSRRESYIKPFATWHTVQSSYQHFGRDIQLDKASHATMRFKILYAVWVRLSFSFLLTMLPTVIFGEIRQDSQIFAVSEAWPNYCPGPTDAISTCYAESRSACALTCLPFRFCIYFSYYVNSGLCYLYSFVSTNISYSRDCTFMMVSFNKSKFILVRQLLICLRTRTSVEILR